MRFHCECVNEIWLVVYAGASISWGLENSTSRTEEGMGIKRAREAMVGVGVEKAREAMLVWV